MPPGPKISTPAGDAPVIPVVLLMVGGYLAWFGIHYWRRDVTWPTDPVKAVLQGKPIPAPGSAPAATTAVLTADVAALQPDPSVGGGGGSGGSGGGGGVSTAGLHNPIGPGLQPARVDMGVDYTGAGPLYAMGDGKITNVYNAGWPGGTFIGLALADGSGRYVYYAENIAPSVSVGQQVKAGQVVGLARGSYPFVEIGWAAPPGTGQTMADKTGQDAAGLKKGDPGAYPTAYGVNMSDTIKALGGPPGIVTGQVQGKV